MQALRKCFAVLFTALLFGALFSLSAFASGESACGDKIASFDVSEDENSSVTATLYQKDGQYFLVFSGEGHMREFSSSTQIPWLEYADGIVAITLENGVMNLTDLFFYNLPSLKELWIYERYVTLIADKQYIPYTVNIYGHFNSTAYLFVYENYPTRFFSVCDFKDGICTECDYVCENHSGGIPTCTEGGKCENCGSEYLSPRGHRLSALVGEVPATCYSVGVSAHHTCLDCAGLFNKDKQPTTEDELRFTVNHDFGELRECVAPTCTDSGFISHYECSLCLDKFNENNEKVDDIFISALGHIGGTATCLSGAVCERCDAIYTDADLTSHSYSSEFKYNESSHWRECICGAADDLNLHSLTDKVIEEATESEMGIIESSCDCGYKTGKYIPKLPPKAEGNIESENPFPFLKVIIITASAIFLCVCTAATVIIVKRTRK